MKQLEWISQAEFDKDDQGDDRAVENAGRHEREVTDDVDQLQAELVFPADEFLFGRRNVV